MQSVRSSKVAESKPVKLDLGIHVRGFAGYCDPVYLFLV